MSPSLFIIRCMIYKMLFDRLKKKRFLFQEVYYQQARPSMTGQAAVGRSVFVILLYRHVFSLQIIPCLYLRFPFLIKSISIFWIHKHFHIFIYFLGQCSSFSLRISFVIISSFLGSISSFLIFHCVRNSSSCTKFSTIFKLNACQPDDSL